MNWTITYLLKHFWYALAVNNFARREINTLYAYAGKNNNVYDNCELFCEMTFNLTKKNLFDIDLI